MKALHKGRGLLGLLLACLLLFAGCREVEDVIAPAQPEPTPLLTILVEELPESLDPLAADTPESIVLAGYLCDGLLEFNPETGRPAPCLAQSWDVSEDGLSLTLYLETGVTFADGTAVNAQAVVQNIQRWQSQGSDQLKDQLSSIQSMRTVGSSQVVLTLSHPDAGLFTVFCAPETGLVSPSSIQAGTVNQDPQGAGSYQLEEQRDILIRLAQREDYFRGAPSHQQVEFRNANAQLAQEWMNQSQDYIVVGGLVSQVTVGGDYERHNATGFQSYQLYLNLQRLPLNTVRQLIGQTIQTEVTIPNGCLDQGGLLPDAVYQGENITFSSNTNATLAQYSYSSLTLICSNDASVLSLALRVQEALESQHCTVTIQSLEEDEFTQAIAQGDYHLCLMKENIPDCSDWLEKFS